MSNARAVSAEPLIAVWRLQPQDPVVAPSRIPGAGDGLFCARPVPKDTVICAYDLINGLDASDGVVPPRTVDELNAEGSHFTHVLDVGGGRHIDGKPYGAVASKINGFYSKAYARFAGLPECGIKRSQCNVAFHGKYVVSTRAIGRLEELYVNYRYTVPNK